MRSNSALPIRSALCGLRGAWRLITSDSVSRVSRGTSSTPLLSACSRAMKGSLARTRISKARARRATCVPIRPRPTTPSVLPRSSVPTNLPGVHSPWRRDCIAWGTLRARASRTAKVCSVAAKVEPPAELTTTIPRRVASSTSMLSTPTPARATTRRLRPALRTSLVTLVALRTTRAS